MDTRFPVLATKPRNHCCLARVHANKIARHIKAQYAPHTNENHRDTRSCATGENKTTVELVSEILQGSIPHAGMPGEIRSGSSLVDRIRVEEAQGRPVNIYPYNQKMSSDLDVIRQAAADLGIGFVMRTVTTAQRGLRFSLHHARSIAIRCDSSQAATHGIARIRRRCERVATHTRETTV